MKKNIPFILSLFIILFSSCNQSEPNKENELTLADLQEQFEEAAKQYQVLCAGCHGQKIAAFVARNWKEGGYLERLPKDPWGTDYYYLNPGLHGTIDVFSLGADGKPGGEKYSADIGNWDADGK